MSSCSKREISKFTITQNIDNSFVFTIKEDNKYTPILIDPSDCFKGTLYNLSDGSEAFSKDMAILSVDEGTVGFLLSADETRTLLSRRGASEDRYFAYPVYSFVLSCVTTTNGAFTAKVPFIYVE